MKITVLVENTALSPVLTAEHGLSILVQTGGKNILIDAGQTDAIIHNCEKMGINLTRVDYLILSHGHYDHCGGVLSFSLVNPSAEIFTSKNAFGEYWNTASGRYIGIDKNIAILPELRRTSGRYKIAENIELFDTAPISKLFPFGNKKLQIKSENGFVPDDFAHEQYAVITENGKKYLFSGCAHRGIVNIMEEFVRIYGEAPYAVVTGFHLMKDSDYSPEESAFITETANELSKYPTQFYSGHCTGNAFEILKNVMGEKLTAIHTGMIIEIS